MKQNFTSYKKEVLLVLFLLSSFLSFSQCPTNIKEAFIQTGLCSPAPVKWTVKYQKTWSSGTAVIRITWGDGTVQNLTGTEISEDGLTWLAVTDQVHSYNSTGNQCQYKPEAVLVLNGVECNNRVSKNVTVWDKDNANGGNQRINPLVYRICQGTDATITFRDNSQFNCTPPATFVNLNKIHRWTQWVYNTFEQNSLSPRIPNVTVGGTIPTASKKGAIVMDPTPALTPTAVSDVVYVPVGGNVGDIFEVKLRNWNLCNPYDGDTLDGAPPTDLIDGDNDPIFSYARIEIVAAPTPYFRRKKTNHSSSGDFLNFCPNETIYLTDSSIVPSGGSLSYAWTYLDNLGNTIATASGKNVTRSFNTPGDYVIRLKIKDLNAQGNCEMTLEKPIKISAVPIASINIGGTTSATHEYCIDNLPSVLTLNQSIASSNASSFEWKFFKRNLSIPTGTPDSTGANSTSTVTDLSLGITKPGVYKVRLTAIDNVTLCSSFTETSIIVYDKPKPVFSANAACASSKTNFSNIISSTPSTFVTVNGDYIEKWEWDFSYDGITFNAERTQTDNNSFSRFLANPTGPTAPLISKAGNYDVALRVTSFKKQCSDIRIINVSVNPQAKTDFSIDKSNGCTPYKPILSYQPDASTTTIDHYVWDFGNGTVTGNLAPGDPIPNPTYTLANTYTIKLTAYTDKGCDTTITHTVTANPVPTVDFTSNYASFASKCSPLTLKFTPVISSPVADIDTLIWTYYDDAANKLSADTIKVTGGMTAANLEHNHTFIDTTFTNIDFKVNLQVKLKAGGCTATKDHNFPVYFNRKIKFDTATISCSPRKIRFSIDPADKNNFIDYKWYFPGGSTTFAQGSADQEITYPNTGSSDFFSNVKLVTTTSYGCKDSTQKQIVVNPQIIAAFDVINNHNLCSGETLFFKNNSTVNGATVKYVWNWGDGSDNDTTTSLTPNISHKFVNVSNLSDAQYLVSMNIITGSCPVTAPQKLVIVERKLTPAISPPQNNLCVSNAGISFQSISFGPIAKTRWKIDNVEWGAAQDMSITPIYNFTNTTKLVKEYLVTLIIESANCKDSVSEKIKIFPEIIAAFDTVANKNIYCSPLEITFKNKSKGPDGTQYYWDFNDGTSNITSITDPDFKHSFENNAASSRTYKITLTAVTLDNCTSTAFKQIIVNPIIKADFTADTTGCAPLILTINNTSTQAELFEWDLDNGSPLFYGITPPQVVYENHTPNFVDHTIKLRAYRYMDKCEDTKSKVIRVFPELKPMFKITPELQKFPSTTVQIEDMTTPVGNWDYEWDFGDNSPKSNLKDPISHTYSTFGEYKIILKVSNSSCYKTYALTAKILPREPIANFGPDKAEGCRPLTVNFINKSEYADSTKYEWSFGDATGSSSNVNPSYTYYDPGTYTVRLIAKNIEGVADDTIKENVIKVYDLPKARFQLRPALVYLPDKPIFTSNLSSGADSYLWLFGDGDTSTLAEPQHIYLDTGKYTVTLIAFNKDGCTDTAVVNNAATAKFGGRVLIPNAFTPNLTSLGIASSEENDFFFPIAEGVVSIDFKIYNRWGELLYYSNKPGDKGWDGFYQGNLCPQDVYMYKVSIKLSDGFLFNKTGDVVLIR